MRILRNYIIKDFLNSLAFAFLSLTFIILLGNLIKITDMIVTKGISPITAFKIFLYYAPYFVKYTLPLAMLLAVLLTMGRLIADNEIIAIRTAGISLWKILSIFLIVGLIISLSLYILNNRISPKLQYKSRVLIKNIYTKNINALIEPGVFLDNFENFVLYVGDVKGNKLKNVYIYQTGGGQNTVTYAKRGEFISEKGILKLKLEDGFRDNINLKNKKELYRLNFAVFFMNMPIKKKASSKVSKKPCNMTPYELRSQIKYFRQKGMMPVKLYIEKYSRLSFSFSALVFVVLGFGVSLMVKHREKSINLGLAFLGALLYYILYLLGTTLAKRMIMPPFFAMWLPDVIILGAGLYLILKHAYFR